MYFVRNTTVRMATGLALGIALALLAFVAMPARAANQAVSITGFAFAPATVNVSVGDTVTWTNNEGGGVPHTASSDTAGVFDSGQLSGGQSFSRTFTTAGSFPYHCNVHPTMTGLVVVAAAAGGTSTPAGGATQAPPAVGTGLAAEGGASTIPVLVVLGATAISFAAATTVIVAARHQRT